MYALLLLVAVSAPLRNAVGRTLEEYRGKPYAEARSGLRADGYVPVKFLHPKDLNVCAGQEWCTVYKEAISFSGTGV